ncbi:hypothetical protein QBC44DRAFT_372907 [Cladorrhinum sp. PSN332]|nr:hypothetical protein QBC44DRAFT_372907 [Cladorrhinum sp. PSN332]
MEIHRRAFLNPVLLDFLAGAEDAYPGASYRIVQENVRLLRKAGITVLAGTDSVGVLPTPDGSGVELPFGEMLHRELRNLVEVGFGEAEALRAATSESAKAWGLNGVVQRGLRADLVLLGSDPLVDIGNVGDVERVWVGDVEFKV